MDCIRRIQSSRRDCHLAGSQNAFPIMRNRSNSYIAVHIHVGTFSERLSPPSPKIIDALGAVNVPKGDRGVHTAKLQ